MAYVETTNLVVLINAIPSNFFQITRGLRKHCALSPHLFIPAMDELNRELIQAKEARRFIG